MSTHLPRSIYAYVDGFNLYHRVLEHYAGRKWFNIRGLIQSRFPNDIIKLVRFFTAPVDDNNTASPRRKRQETYWRILRDSGVTTHFGRIEDRPRKCKAAACGQFLEFIHPTEKMSDVCMALKIVTDALDNPPGPGIVCVVTADMDVLPALRTLRERSMKSQIHIMLPGGDPNQYYSRLENFGQFGALDQILGADVENFQFPNPYTTRSGHSLNKPATW